MSKFSQEHYDRVKRDLELVTKKICNYEKRSLPADEKEREERIQK